MASMSLLQRASVNMVATLSGLCLGTQLVFRGFLMRGFPKTITPVQHSRDHVKRLLITKSSGFYDKRFLSLMNLYILLTGVPVAIGITLVKIYSLVKLS
uniref:NADH dehydrogenase [ubiquinone] 1 beta subcomplex subunit 5, mitochondrial n=1 Tax=Rhinolophus ferrumequinum TaxID=59479 RepID=A0A671FNP6_RHIFE